MPNSAKEKATQKGAEIAKIKSLPRLKRKNFNIEIVGISPIEEGVEVFVKAWTSNGQVGFSDDGSVEIERFRIFNPPILVPDSNGPIERVSMYDGVAKKYYLREDPQEALLQVIEHNLSVISLHDSSNIIPGKVGNTTSTFFPAAGNTSPVDGRVWKGSSAWATLRAAATGTAETSDASGTNFGASKWGAGASDFDLYRAVFCFNTAAISTDTISAATLSIFKDTNAVRNTNTTSARIVGYTGSTNTLVTGDYNIANFGGTSFSSIAFSSISTNAYNDFALDSNGIANINKTGVSGFGGMNSIDFLNGTAPTGNNDISIFYADDSGTTRDPKLVVTHAAAVTFKPRVSMFM